MSKKVTIKDLAKLLDLSVSTVSKSLNNSPEISKPTKKRVRELAKIKNYTPNQVAINLKRKHTKSIGVIIPNILDEFFAMLLHGVEKEATKRGYRVIICISNELLKKEKESIKTFINGSVDGIMLSLSKETQRKGNYQHIQQLLNQNFELLLFDRTSDLISCDKVMVDDLQGALNATLHLLNSGCKNILFVSTIFDTNVGLVRQEGYVKALNNWNIDLEPKILNIASYDMFEENLVKQINLSKPDAILCVNERSAVLTLQIVQRNGYSVPDDISVVGFTNGSMAQSALPSLTTVSQHAENIGKTSVKKLIDRIEKLYVGKPQHKIVKTELIARNSTKTLL